MTVGISNVAKIKEKLWTKKTKRPFGWQGSVWGLVIHTTGSGLPSKATKEGQEVIDRALAYYSRSHGCHYVCGWDEDSLWQVANEIESANGVGVTAIPSKNQKGQTESVAGKYNGSWEEDLPASLVKRWKERWKNTDAETPLDLFPTKYANSCYVHVEMPPCVFHHNSKLVTAAEPLEEGLRFTKAQHDNVAELAFDIAERNGWPSGWLESGRLVCHEDITPISRHDRNGGWDPGVLRASPRFDWDYLVEKIEELVIENWREELVGDSDPDTVTFAVTDTWPAVEDTTVVRTTTKGTEIYRLGDRIGFWHKIVDFFRRLFKRGK